MPDPLYQKHFYPTLALTAHYHAMRVHVGKFLVYQSRARGLAAGAGWTDAVEQQLALAKGALEEGLSSLTGYDSHMLTLLGNAPHQTIPGKRQLLEDYVLNPKADYFKLQLAELAASLQRKSMTS